MSHLLLLGTIPEVRLGGLAHFLEKFKNQPKITKLGIIVELDV